MAVMPRRALLNDINPHLINFYQWLKRGLVIALPMTKSEMRYYDYRERFNALLARGQGASAEAAALFYYLNRTGYNGLCRFNRNGEFNVPFGQYRKINYWRDFSDYCQVFANWELSTLDFENVLLQPDDFVYADPPYDVPFTQYAKEGFGWNDQVRTAEWLAAHPGPVVLANQATPRVMDLYHDLGYHLRLLDGPRRISCTGDRGPATEVLALKNLPDAAQSNRQRFGADASM